MTVPTASDLTTFGGLVIFVTLLMELLKRTLPGLDVTRWGPLMAVLTGIVVSVIAVLALGLSTDPAFGIKVFNAVILGVFAGLGASGLYDNSTSLNRPTAVLTSTTESVTPSTPTEAGTAPPLK